MTILEQRSYLQGEIERRKNEIERLRNDISKMKQIIKTLEALQPPCDKCNGKGETIGFDGGDSYFERCYECDGTGKRKKKP